MHKEKKQGAQANPGALNHSLASLTLFRRLEDNIALFDRLFTDVDTMISRRFACQNQPTAAFCLYFTDGLISSSIINEHIVQPLMEARGLMPGTGLLEAVRDRFVAVSDVKESGDLRELVEAVTYGDTVLFIQGADRALILSTKAFALRAIGEPEGEKVLTGPREGFTEGIMVNLSLLRRRLRTHELKLKMQSIGRSSATSICICYLDNIVNKRILAELYRRLAVIDVDGIMDSNHLTEYIAERSALGFPTCGYTERPDVVAARLLEGRIAIMVDGTPMVLTLPYLFVENFQSNEDYYLNPVYATFTRLLRIVGFALTITVPSLYVAIVAYHHEVMQTALMISIASERQGVPLPAALECICMLLVFDILRESGVRTPSQVGQALGIVGALVIGQAAVEARLVAAPMVIVVAFTGITNLLVPKMGPSALFCRYFFLLLSSILGLTGLVSGCAALLIHLFNLHTLGVPSVLPMHQLGFQDVKDTFIRAPWPQMRTRLYPLSRNRTRTGDTPPRAESEEIS